MAFTKLTFSKVWTDPTAFPTVEENETKVREDLQVLHDETRDALNQLIDDLEDTGGDGSAASNIGAKLPDGTVSTVQGALDALDTAKQDVLTFDSVPTASSDNPVTSDGLFTSFATLAAAKQDKLVSGSNIKTVNSTSLLGSGNVAVQETLVSGSNIKTINSSSVLGSGDISLLTPSGNSSNTTVTFTEAGSRTNIATGETLAVLFGKIKKFFTDLGTAAFKNSTNTVSSGSTDLVESGAVYSAIPTASTSTPSMDGTGAAGTGSTYSRGDHVHPSDTSKQDTLVSGTNIKTINGNSILGSGNITISSTGNQYIIDYGSTSSSDIYSNFLGGADLYLVNETGFGTDTPFIVAVDSDLSSSSSVYLDVDLFGHYTGGGYIRYHVAGTTWTVVESEEYADANEVALTKTVSGRLAHFTDAANAPLKSLIAYINAVQAGSGTPSPGNPRAISGFTGANITRTGKNLVYISDKTGSNQQVTFTCSGGKVSLSGTAANNAWYTLSDDFVLKAGTYTLSGGGQNNAYLSLRTPSNTAIASTRPSAGDATFTLAADTTVRLRATASSGTDTTGIEFTPQIEVGSTATAYEVYNGDTETFDWSGDAGTVYGGTLNVTTGVLTVTHVMHTYNGTDGAAWQFNTVDASRNRISLVLDDVKLPSSYSSDFLANYLGPSLAASPQEWLASITNQGVLRIGVPTSITSKADWETYLGSDNLVLVYELATQQTYQLTPTEIDTLLGINNIFADTGDVEVEYIPNTDLATAVDDLQRNKQDKLISGTNIKTVGGQTLLGSTDVPIALPYVAIADFDSWNTALELTELSADVAITLPSVPSGVTAEVRITASQGAGNSYKITLTAPTGTTITDGSTSGASLVITPTAEKYIEISAAVIGNGTIISVLTNEV